MRFLSFAVLTLALLWHGAWADQPPVAPLALSLAQAKSLAVAHQVALLLASEQVQESNARSREALSRLLPSLDLRSYQTRQTENLRALGFNTPLFPILIGPFDTFDARLRLSQQIFDLSSIHELTASRAAEKAASLKAQATAQQVAGAAALAYIETQRARATVAAATANLALSASLLQLARDQLKAGTGTGVDVVRAENVHSTNTLALRQARSSAAEAETRLHRALGIDLATPISLTDALQSDPMPLPALPDSLQTANQSRHELQALREVVAQRENERKAATAVQYPTVSLAGDVGASGVNPTHYDYHTYSVGVQLAMPLFAGGAITARQDQATSRLRQAELQLRDTNQQVEEDVQLSLIALETATDQIRTAESGLTLAERLMDQAQDRFQTGVADNLEVVSAQANLATARGNRIDALAFGEAAWINYQLAVGKLDFGALPPQ